MGIDDRYYGNSRIGSLAHTLTLTLTLTRGASLSVSVYTTSARPATRACSQR